MTGGLAHESQSVALLQAAATLKKRETLKRCIEIA
jgi:hypothetical protein